MAARRGRAANFLCGLWLVRTDDFAALAIFAVLPQVAAFSGADDPRLAAKAVETDGSLACTAMSAATNEILGAALVAAVVHAFFAAPAVLAGSGAALPVADYLPGTAFQHRDILAKGVGSQTHGRHHGASEGSSEHAQHFAAGNLAGDHSRYVIE